VTAPLPLIQSGAGSFVRRADVPDPRVGPVPDLIRDSEFYEFQKEALRVGNHLVFHSFVDGAPASLWRIVAIERRRYDGRILGLEFSGGVDHWCDGVVVAGTPSLTRSGNEGGRGDRTLKASYLRLSVQWRLLTSR
jgi:hypothetical protein